MTKKDKVRDTYLQKKYGISLCDYNKKLTAQMESCALCRRHRTHFKASLHVDHNHKTGVVRGLVCYSCNRFKIGRNNISTAKALYDYMLTYESAVCSDSQELRYKCES